MPAKRQFARPGTGQEVSDGLDQLKWQLSRHLDRRATPVALRPFPMAQEFPHIVVMDADLVDLDATARVLSGRGYHITLSSSLIDDFTLRSLQPDLIILDPVMLQDGDDAIPANDQISWLSPSPRVPILWCTSDPAVKPGPGRSGMTTIAKPVRERDVVFTVETLLDWRIDHHPQRASLDRFFPHIVPVVPKSG